MVGGCLHARKGQVLVPWAQSALAEGMEWNGMLSSMCCIFLVG